MIGWQIRRTDFQSRPGATRSVDDDRARSAVTFHGDSDVPSDPFRLGGRACDGLCRRLCRAVFRAATARQATGARQAAAPAKAAPAQKQAAPTPQPEPPPFKETALTDKQVEGVLDSQKELDAIAAKIPQPKGNEPPKADPAITAQFEDVAKKHGFADYADYNNAVETISIVLGGFDPKTKTYVGPEAMMKQQIAAVQADKKMPAKDKKAALDEMNAMLKSPPPRSRTKPTSRSSASITTSSRPCCRTVSNGHRSRHHKQKAPDLVGGFLVFSRRDGASGP